MTIEARWRLGVSGGLRNGATWWVVGGLIAFLTALAVAILWRQPFLIPAISVGALVPVVVRTFWGHWPALVAVLVLVGVLGALAIAGIAAALVPVGWGINWTGNSQGRTTETVTYQAQVVLDGAVIRLDEEITDQALGPDVKWAPEYGWQFDRTVDGVPVYRRSREALPPPASLVMSVVDVPIALGVGPNGARLVPSAGSGVTITAPKGALGVIAPAPQNVVAAPRQREVASVPLGPRDDHVTVTVRAHWLRNPMGRSVDEFFAWGPTAWLVGAAAMMGSSVVVARVSGGVDRFLVGILRQLRRPVHSPWRTSIPQPRKPLRRGDPGLVRRPRVRR